MTIRNKMHYQEFVYDFDVDGGAVSTIALGSLPLGALVDKVDVKVLTGVTSAGAATLAFENDTADAYIAAAAKTDYDTANEVQSSGSLAVSLDAASNQPFNLTIGTAALTAGKLLCMVKYTMPTEDL